jgi:hypothetical protein
LMFILHLLNIKPSSKSRRPKKIIRLKKWVELKNRSLPYFESQSYS